MERRLDMKGGGVLALRQEGPRVHLEAWRRLDDRGLYKVWLLGQQGGRMLLGTLTPEGKELRLRRTLSAAELERADCWPAAGAEAVLAFAFSNAAPEPNRWYCEQSPQRLTADPVLRRQLKAPMLCSRGRDGFRLAVPFRPEAPVALESLFCLARLERVEGRSCLVWDFNRDGTPKFLNKEEGPGTE